MRQNLAMAPGYGPWLRPLSSTVTAPRNACRFSPGSVLRGTRSARSTIAVMIVFLGALSLPGCDTFQSRSGSFACGGPDDCDATRLCEDGFCILRTDLPDADPSTPDADPSTPDADLTVTGCELCLVSGTCESDCGTGTCSQACLGSCDCNFDCAGAASCRIGGEAESKSTVDCTNAVLCNTKCENLASCEVDCTGATTCGMICEDQSSCLLRCAGAATCNISSCDLGGTISCAGDIIVCNRACP